MYIVETRFKSDMATRQQYDDLSTAIEAYGKEIFRGWRGTIHAVTLFYDTTVISRHIF